MGGIFAGSSCLTARLRDKDDSWNAAAGGAAAGSVFGLRGESSVAVRCIYQLCVVNIELKPTVCVNHSQQ